MFEPNRLHIAILLVTLGLAVGCGSGRSSNSSSEPRSAATAKAAAPSKYMEPDLAKWGLKETTAEPAAVRQRIEKLMSILPKPVADNLFAPESGMDFTKIFVSPDGASHDPSVANYILDIAKAYLELERGLSDRNERYGAALDAAVVFQKYQAAVLFAHDRNTSPQPRAGEFSFFVLDLGQRLGDRKVTELGFLGYSQPSLYRQRATILVGDYYCDNGKPKEANWTYYAAATNGYGDESKSDDTAAEIARDRPMCGAPGKVIAEFVREQRGGAVPGAATAVSTPAASTPKAALWPDLSNPPSGGKPHPDDAAVVIAIERYMAVPEVTGARRNANDWYRYFSSYLKIPASKLELLRDNEATVEKMRAAVARVAANVGPKGTLWLVFIGHGAPAKDGRDGVLVGADAQQDADGLYARSLPQKELLATLAKGRQQRTVVVLDTCFSGRTGQGAAIAKGLQPLIPVAGEVARQSSATVLTAGGASEFAGPLNGIDRPAFSYLVLGAMRGWGDDNKDGTVTANEAVSYARQALSITVKGRTQTPELISPSPNLPLSEGARDAAPNLSDIVMAE
jgi:hypothetical protein